MYEYFIYILEIFPVLLVATDWMKDLSLKFALSYSTFKGSLYWPPNCSML